MTVVTTQETFAIRNAPAERKERQIRNIFANAGCYVRNDNGDSRQDFVATINGRFEFIEVKNEDNYSKSGNIAIETYQHDRDTQSKIPSGIATTEAKVCIHTLADKAAIYRTRPMVYFLTSTQRLFTESGFRDSDHGNGGRLLPVKELLQFDWFDYCNLCELPKSKVFRFTFSAKQAGMLTYQLLTFIGNKGWEATGQLELI